MSRIKNFIILIVAFMLPILSANSQEITHQQSDTAIDLNSDKITFTAQDIIVLADSFLALSNRDNAVFKTNFDYLLNTYIEKDNPYYDAVFVHLVSEYIQKGKVNWLEIGEVNWMINRSNQLSATLPGKIAPKLLMKNPEGSAQFLTQIVQPTEKAILLFWDTDCDKCINAATALNQILQVHPNSASIRVLTISSEENIVQWQGNISAKNLNHWEHYVDPTINKDGFRNFAINATPTFFFIGQNGEIWSKMHHFQDVSKIHKLLGSNNLIESIERMASDDDWHLNLLIKKLNQFLNKP